MKRYLHILLLTCVGIMIAANTHAQTCQVTGIVVDAEENLPLQGANVTYKVNGQDYACVTNDRGQFSFTLPRGTNTTVYVSFMGFQKISKVVSGKDKKVALKLELLPSDKVMKEVMIKRNVPIVIVKGDTIEYRASDYKPHIDAVTLELLIKIPGFEWKDGKLYVNGEEVKDIQIDGREFFKNDNSLPLKNLPANVIEKIQVYDQLSDYAKLTGFDDGETRKTINFITKKGTSRSQFGKMTAGGGIKDRYKLYGMYNLFRDDIRWSVFGQLNNINEQNFSMIDLLSATGTASSSAPSQSPYSKGSSDNTYHPTTSDDISSMMVDVSDYGVTTSRAIGTNYSDEWAKGKMKFSGHYLFNSSSNYTDYHIYDDYFGETASNNLQDMKVDNDNINHRFNAKYEYNITDRDYLLVRPTLAYQKKKELADLTDWTVMRDSLTQLMTDTALLLTQQTSSDQYVVSTSGEAMYMHKFGSRGHALSADARISYVHTHEDIGMNFENVQTDDAALQSTMCKNTQETYTYMLSWLNPFGKDKHHFIKVDAGWNKTYGIMRRRTEMNANGAEEFTLDTLLSGSTWSNFGGLLVNVAYLVKYPKVNLVAGTEFQMYDLYNANDKFYFKRHYKTFLPYAFLRYRLSRGQLLVQYKTTNKYPGLAQVHDAINNANAVMAIRGSIRLEPAYHHNMMARLVLPVLRNGSVFVLFANLEQADNYIGSLRSLASESYAQEGERRNTEILSYTNTDGYFSWSSLVAYGFPWKAISSNINISSTVKHNKIPGYRDNIKQFTSQWNWSGSLTVGSNISSDVDFVLDINGKYTRSQNLTFTDMNVNFWSLSYGGQLNWQFLPMLKVTLECGRTNYFGQGTSQFNAIISNAAIAYKFLKGRKGELRFSVYDILNQDNSFYQTTTELYRREVSTNILGRYAMLSFTYNLNTNQ